MLYFGTNNLNLYKFHVDFATPSNSTFTGPTVINVAAFNALCNGGTCVPQPSVTQQLVRVPAGRAPQRVKYHASSSLLNRGKINDLSQARQVGRFHVEQFGGRLAGSAATQQRLRENQS